MGLSLVVAGLGGSRSEKRAVGLSLDRLASLTGGGGGKLFEKRKEKKPRRGSWFQVVAAVGLDFRWWVSVSGGGSRFQVVAAVGLGFRWWLPWVSPCFNRIRRESESTESTERREKREERDQSEEREKKSVEMKISEKINYLYLVVPRVFF